MDQRLAVQEPDPAPRARGAACPTEPLRPTLQGQTDWKPRLLRGRAVDHPSCTAQGSASSSSNRAPPRVHPLRFLHSPHTPANVSPPPCLCIPGRAPRRETRFCSSVHGQPAPYRLAGLSSDPHSEALWDHPVPVSYDTSLLSFLHVIIKYYVIWLHGHVLSHF